MDSRTALRMLATAALSSMAIADGGGDAPRLIAELDRRIAEEPADPKLYRQRGELNFMVGRIGECIADFDREVELAPGNDPHHWQRGIGYYYAGEFHKGRAQFERHRSVNPSDVENAAWHYFCVAREEGLAAAQGALIPIDTARDMRVPMAEIYALLAGKGTEEAVIAAAEGAPEAERRQALQYAHLYLGLWHEVRGDPVSSLSHIRRSAEEYSMAHYMGAVARTHLKLREETQR